MATVFRPLTSDWELICAGPATLQVRGGVAYIATGTTEPNADDILNCFTVENVFAYSGSENVYARMAYDPTAGTERVYLNGQRATLGAGNDYTISGNTITFSSALATGDVVLVDYEY